MKETLKCTDCNRNWRREKTRGRKPTTCPKCTKAIAKQKIVEVKQIKTNTIAKNTTQQNDENKKELSVAEVFQYYHPSDQKLAEETKGGSQWKCKHCGYKLTLKLSVSAKPTHKCSEGSKSYPMERDD